MSENIGEKRLLDYNEGHNLLLEQNYVASFISYQDLFDGRSQADELQPSLQFC